MSQIHPVKQIKLGKHLDEMLAIDKALYERIMDTTGFAYHFNEICKLAATGDYWYDSCEHVWTSMGEGYYICHKCGTIKS